MFLIELFVAISHSMKRIENGLPSVCYCAELLYAPLNANKYKQLMKFKYRHKIIQHFKCISFENSVVLCIWCKICYEWYSISSDDNNNNNSTIFAKWYSYLQQWMLLDAVLSDACDYIGNLPQNGYRMVLRLTTLWWIDQSEIWKNDCWWKTMYEHI